MLKKISVPALLLAFAIPTALAQAEEPAPKVPMAQLCANCHKE